MTRPVLIQRALNGLIVAPADGDNRDASNVLVFPDALLINAEAVAGLVKHIHDLASSPSAQQLAQEAQQRAIVHELHAVKSDLAGAAEQAVSASPQVEEPIPNLP
jgi:hypothetical protein